MVEQEAEVHRKRHRPGGVFEDREARCQRGSRLGLRSEVTAVGLDRAHARLRPEQQIRAGIIAAFIRKRAGDVGHGFGLAGEPCELSYEVTANHESRSHSSCEPGERVIELTPGHRLRPVPIAQAKRLFVREVDSVGDAGEARRVDDGAIPPFPADIGERDEVPGQVAAVDGGDVSRIERP